jgi:hypothetical protein
MLRFRWLYLLLRCRCWYLSLLFWWFVWVPAIVQNPAGQAMVDCAGVDEDAVIVRVDDHSA